MGVGGGTGRGSKANFDSRRHNAEAAQRMTIGKIGIDGDKSA